MSRLFGKVRCRRFPILSWILVRLVFGEAGAQVSDEGSPSLSHPYGEITVGRKPVYGGVHTYGGKVIDKRLLYNPNLEAIFGVPFHPDTYTYQYYYVPPYGHNSPYLYPSDTQNYYYLTPVPVPNFPFGYSSPPSVGIPRARQEKVEKKDLPTEIVLVVTSVIDGLMRREALSKSGVSMTGSKVRYMRIGDWRGNISLYGGNYGKVYLSNSKGERLEGHFNKSGNSTYYDLDVHSGGERQSWRGNTNLTNYSGFLNITSNSGDNIRGYVNPLGNGYYYNYRYDSSSLNVRMNNFSTSSDRYNLYISGEENIYGYLY
ncbi:MAG: hypothetical protein N3G21_13440 [Candidatus Hydrogenedentes bacterium]|nr:hypothetical protein [Candidatus Hydrogenedentota bacterium]